MTHAGTARHDGRLVSAGGRVLAVTAVGEDLADARRRAYTGVDLVEVRGSHHRRDIAAAAAATATVAPAAPVEAGRR